jgi:hypothetical protein
VSFYIFLVAGQNHPKNYDENQIRSERHGPARTKPAMAGGGMGGGSPADCKLEADLVQQYCTSMANGFRHNFSKKNIPRT